MSLISVRGWHQAGPAHHRRHAIAAFPVGVLLAAERRGAAVGPGERLGAVVGGVDHDGVVGDAEVVELLQELADLAVVLDHAVGIDAEPGLALRLGLEAGPDVHAGRIEPDEERLLVLVRAVDEVERGVEELLVDRLHALLGRAGRCPRSSACPMRRSADPRPASRRWSPCICSTPRGPNLQLELGVLRIVGVLRLVLGVEVIEVAEELVEAVHGRQELVAVAEMVLAELSGRVAERLEQLGERRVLVRQAFLRSRQADLQEAGAHRALAGDERGAAGGAGLLAVIVGEDRAFVGDAVDVGRAVAHHAAVVGADVPVADVVAHDDEDVRLLLLLRGRG